MGIPAALEHPEAAADPGAVDRVLAREPIPPPLRVVTARSVEALNAVHEFDIAKMELAGEPVESRRGKLREILLRGLAADAGFPATLHRCADPVFDRLSAAVFMILASRSEAARVLDLTEEFDVRLRQGYRDFGEAKKQQFSQRWETGSGAAGCAEFDRRLEEDMAKDELLAAAIAHGLAPALVDRAASIARGLRRLEALEVDAPENPIEHGRLALDALTGIQAFAALSPDAALFFRASARRLVFGGPLGSALARLDLTRAERALRETCAAPESAIFIGDLYKLPFHGASLATTVPGCEAVERDFFQLGVEMSHERALSDGNGDMAKSLDGIKGLLSVNLLFRGLRLDDAARRNAFEPTSDDLARESKRFVYRPPPSRIRGRVASAARASFPEDAALKFFEFPETMRPGEHTVARVKFTNTGEEPWAGPEFKLAAVKDQDGDTQRFLGGQVRVFLQKTALVSPGEDYTFEFEVIAPAEPRAYAVEFRMVREFIRFFGDSAHKTVTVKAR
jgi:hypothetical protein